MIQRRLSRKYGIRLHCIICGEIFVRNRHTTSRAGTTMRGRRAITCSKKCSKKYVLAQNGIDPYYGKELN